jgi:hypothetical protein
VIEYLSENFGRLKNNFINLISTSKSYPDIEWLMFSDQCKKWKLIDNHLTFSEIDNAFISVNYDGEQLDNNDNRALCRYEFLEIVVRLAIVKFFICKKKPTIVEALRELLENHIFANSCEVMPWQEFRDEHLWKIEIDQTLKSNKQGLDQLFRKLIGKERVFGKEQALDLFY